MLNVQSTMSYETIIEYQKKEIDVLKRKNDYLRRFAHAISHDLKEPLRTIKSYLRFLELEYKGKLDLSGQDCGQREQ